MEIASFVSGDVMTVREGKKRKLHEIVRQLGRAAVAFSGGVDSSYLLAICRDLLGTRNILALTADSPLTPPGELADACDLAAHLGVPHQIVSSDDLSNPDVVSNPPDRCYYCKRHRFEALMRIAQAEGFPHLVHGENADDAADYRPGSRAARELGVRAPLLESGLSKVDVRAMARERGLDNWDRPANACLASRFPYGTPLSKGGLHRVGAAEDALRQMLRLRQLRVRDHFPIARLEVPPEAIAGLAEANTRSAILDLLHGLGYRYVTLDLAGYRMGSLNDEVLLREMI
jgi:uncharacterized protein